MADTYDEHVIERREIDRLRKQIERLHNRLEVSEACNIAKSEVLLDVEIALARDSDIDVAMNIILAAKPR